MRNAITLKADGSPSRIKSTGSPDSNNWLWLLPLPFFGPVLSLAAVWLLGSRDGLAFLCWWVMLLVFGLAFWPLAQRIFHATDKNLSYLPAKAAGLGLLALLHWTSDHLLKGGLSATSILMLTAALATATWGGTWICDRRRSFRMGCPPVDEPAGHPWPRVIFNATLAEAGFAILLLAGALARSFKPDLDSLEKFMNIAFINSILRSNGLPAADPWFAGHSINYYYFGHYVYALLTRLSGLKTAVAYNLGMATTWAFAGSLSFTLGAQLTRLARQDVQAASRLERLLPRFGGLMAWFLVTVGGNGHAFFYSEKGPGRTVISWLAAHNFPVGDLNKAYWFADAVRFIGYNPETTDKTIHEFPFYSFLVADLHAHVIDLTFVLLLLILLTGLAGEAKGKSNQAIGLDAQAICLDIPYPELLAASLLLAVFRMANFWDFVIYLPLVLLAIFSFNLVRSSQQALPGLPLVSRRSRLWTTIRRTALQVAGCIILSLLVSLPFDSHFQPMSSRVALAEAHSPVIRLLVLWGAPVIAGLLWIIVLFIQHIAASQSSKTIQRGTAIQLGSANQRWLMSDWIAAAFFAYALVLLIAPELVYVVDIYQGDYKRANTMFKLTYQAFVLLGIAWSYGLSRLLGLTALGQDSTMQVADSPAKLALGQDSTMQVADSTDKLALGQDSTLQITPSINLLALGQKARKWLAISLMIALLLVPAWYPLLAARQWLGPMTLANRKGLDGLAPLGIKNSAQVAGDSSTELEDDLAAIAWFNDEVAGQPVILEAAGRSYTDAARISSFTGLPTVIGWETHEWLWRTSQATPDAYATAILPRQNDVSTIYTTTDQAKRRELLAAYQVRYVIIGNIERTAYENLIQEDLILELGDVVFSRPTLKVIAIRN